MKRYFNVNYEFDREAVYKQIDRCIQQRRADYICVADGVVLSIANRKLKYLDVINGGMFSICDSSYVPLYINMLHGVEVQQYCGSQIFKDVVSSRKYRMIFLGTQQHILDALQKNLMKMNPDVASMKFVELPFKKVMEFDYTGIAKMIEEDGAGIIWVALGAPKQEFFMSMLKPHLNHGVIIAVGAVFKFFSGIGEKRAPKWMVDNHLEFIYRILKTPRKQFRRCFHIVRTLPRLLYEEWRRKSLP